MARLLDDASNEFLDTFGASPPVTGAACTIAAWFYRDEDTTAGMYLAQLEDKDVDNHRMGILTVGSEDGTGVLRCYTTAGGSFYDAEASASWTQDEWTHACAVFAASNSRTIYLNGGNADTDTGNAAPSNVDRLSIGRAGDSTSGGYHSGGIAEMAIWNVALTAAEAAILASGASPLTVRPGSLVFYVPFIRDDDEDIVGGISLNAYNTPSVTTHPRVFYPSLTVFRKTGSTAATTTIRLTWTDNSEYEDGFSIERDTDDGGFGEIDTVAADVETYDDVGVDTGHTYTYRVKATSATLGDSEYSNEAEISV